MRHTHYKPFGHELTNWEWCGTRMSLDSDNTDVKAHVTCSRCLKKMKLPRCPKCKQKMADTHGHVCEKEPKKVRLAETPVGRTAGKLVRLMQDSEHDRYVMIDHFIGEKPHAMVIVAVTKEHCAILQKKLKTWLRPRKKEPHVRREK